MSDFLLAVSGPLLLVIWTVVTVRAIAHLRTERVARGRRDAFAVSRARRVVLLCALWMCVFGLASASLTTYAGLLSPDFQRLVSGTVRLALLVLGVTLFWSRED